MAGPIGHGVFKALDDRRGKERRPQPVQGWGVFVATTIALSWFAAVVVTAGAGHPSPDQPVTMRLLWASLFYAATMGWQPLVAAWIARHLRTRRHVTDHGARRPRIRDIGLALVVAVGLAALAMVVARIVGEAPARAEELAPTSASALVAIAVLIVLCVQSLGEEYGWRGAPMAYAIERWGTRAGLVVHGVAWGLWYAPLFMLSAPSPADSLAPAGGFVVTCMLLGIVFGWLRLRSGSIVPPAIANAVLTIVAGLPLLLSEGSAGLRDAVFRWPGWPVLGVVAIVLLVGRRHDFELASPPTE